MKRAKKSIIDKFIAMSVAEKEHNVKQIEDETPGKRLARSRPLNARERQQSCRVGVRRPPSLGERNGE